MDFEYIFTYQKPKFKKFFPMFQKNLTDSQNEKNISCKTINQLVGKILLDNHHPNIAKIYNVTNDYIEMEFIDTNHIDQIDLRDLFEVKKYLQKLGIMLTNWNWSNIGVGSDGKVKIYNFDNAGIIDISNPDQWILEPLESKDYILAIKEGFCNPIQIDDYCFTNGLVGFNTYTY